MKPRGWYCERALTNFLYRKLVDHAAVSWGATTLGLKCALQVATETLPIKAL